MSTHFLATGPADASHTLVLAHGAGGPMDAPFMNKVADGLAARGVRVVRFEFPYMAARRTGGKKGGAPDRPAVLIASWEQVVEELGGGARLFIGGKSMGGRIASMVADRLGVHGLVCLGYPFHPPGQPAKLRTEHLRDLATTALILQGERDPFGTRDEVPGFGLSKRIEVVWVPDGDHSFKPRKSSGASEAGNLALAIEEMATFIGRT
jgi:predicted alpha/beta-hydrolase family hydrolase